MTRSSYASPGVYVEEVPSARQPITGVGTNTVGFIGIVPDKVYIPRASAKYNPVTALKKADARRDVVIEEMKKSSELQLKAGKDELAALEKELVTASKDTEDKKKKRDDAKSKRDAIAVGPDTAADSALADATTAFEKASNIALDLDQKVKLKKAAVDSAAVQTEIEDSTYAPMTAVPTAQDLIASEDRPYYFEVFTVRAAEFDTKLCTNFTEYADRFGDFSGFSIGPVTTEANAMWRYKPLSPGHHMLTHAVSGFFKNGGTRCFVARVSSAAGLKKALERFESIDEVAIIAAPGLPKIKSVWEELQLHCEHPDHQNIFAILDTPAIIGSNNELDTLKLTYGIDGNLLPRESKHAALYFPYIEVSDPAKRLQDEDPARGIDAKYRGLTYVAPSGHMAGVYARIDEERGVHKAPANAVLRGALEVKYYVSKQLQAGLNPQGVNCLRIMGGAVVAWGARTIGGDRNGEWKYINVRRFAGFLEESIDEGTQWVVFEPNDPALWSKIRLNVTSFLTNVWRNGALFGLTPEESFYVKCDAELNPPEVRDLGQVITEIGVAIVRPAEFVIFRISQSTGVQQS